MLSKPIGGARQAAIEASAKRHALNAAEKPSKRLKTDHYPDAIPKDDLSTNIDVDYEDMKNYRDHLKEMFCKGKHSVKDTLKTSVLSSRAGAGGVDDMVKCGNIGRAHKMFARDMLNKVEKASDAP